MLSRDEYCILIVVSPRWYVATYFDSGNLDVKKDYTRIRGVLDEALDGYAQKGGQFENKGERLTEDNRHIFFHGTGFHCIKQKTAYEILRSDWSSDVCSSDLKRNVGKDQQRKKSIRKHKI